MQDFVPMSLRGEVVAGRPAPVRALLLGATGIDKEDVAKRLRDFQEETADPRVFLYRDFEKDFVAPRFRGGMAAFLDAEEPEQWSEWRVAWQEFARWQSEHQADNLVLGIHGVIARQLFGVRSAAYLPDLQEFNPTHLVTLIDDIYCQWFRVQQRAHGHAYRGQPTIPQLLEARRAELFVGDLIHRNLDPSGRSLVNWLFAVRHPARLLQRLLFADPHALTPIYLSFPISEPRVMAANGDPSGIALVNRFLGQATDWERQNPHVAMFCPLSIDELPFVRSAERGDDDPVTFDLSSRWDVSDFYGTDRLLTESPIQHIQVPCSELTEAAGPIASDVGRRDYRLVKQAKALAVFCPIFNQRTSSGVRNEIQFAIRLHTPVHIFQDPQHESPNQARNLLHGGSGALGRAPGEEYIEFHDSLESALEAAARP
jgi:hypothetical protein